MNNPNEKGVIYYGTHIDNITLLDQKGITTPPVRQEQYISVSISGYMGLLKCELFCATFF